MYIFILKVVTKSNFWVSIFFFPLQIIEVVCCKLTPLQLDLYNHFIHSKNVGSHSYWAVKAELLELMKRLSDSIWVLFCFSQAQVKRAISEETKKSKILAYITALKKLCNHPKVCHIYRYTNTYICMHSHNLIGMFFCLYYVWTYSEDAW